MLKWLTIKINQYYIFLDDDLEFSQGNWRGRNYYCDWQKIYERVLQVLQSLEGE